MRKFMKCVGAANTGDENRLEFASRTELRTSILTVAVILIRTRSVLFSVSLVLLMFASMAAYGQDVILYDQPNYTGAAKHVGPTGVYRFFDTAGFNDRTVSVKVPAGLVAILYADADDYGGYGNYIDLMEDCPNLARYHFEKRVSFVKVFNAVKPGYYWARNSYQNGVFVAGHWERSRIGGINQINAVAVVGPALPPNVPTAGPTRLHKDGATTIIDSLGSQSDDLAARWLSAMDDQLGVIGSDYDGPEQIGSAAFERRILEDGNPPTILDPINFWYPQKRHGESLFIKRTLVGTVTPNRDGALEKENNSGEDESDATSPPHIADVSGLYFDRDFNVDVAPDPKYRYLITESHPPALSIQQSVKLTKENFRLHNATGEYNNPCTQPFQKVEAEIDSSPAAKSRLLDHVRINQKIGIYGPWIYDKGHCYHPEIHPAEEIWWTTNIEGGALRYHLNLFCDSSKRFWWRDQMDDGTKLKPWGAPPIRGTFAIAFEAEIGKPGKKFEVSNEKDNQDRSVDYNVIEYPNTDQVYNLMYKGNVLISFVPHNNAFIAYFDRVGLRPGSNNIVRGFLVLKTSVGTVKQTDSGRIRCLSNLPPWIVVPQGADPNHIDQCAERGAFEKVEGFYMFTVLRTDIR